MVIVRSLTPLGVSAGFPPPHPHKVASPAITTNAKATRLLLARALVAKRHNLKSFRTFGDSRIDFLRRSKAHHHYSLEQPKGTTRASVRRPRQLMNLVHTLPPLT